MNRKQLETMTKIFIVIETWGRGVEHDDPTVVPFSTREKARDHLKQLVKDDQTNGITTPMQSDLEENPDSWEVTDEPDRYYAFCEDRNCWYDVWVEGHDIR